MCSDKEPGIEATLPDQNRLLGNLVMPYMCKQGMLLHKLY